MKRKSGYYWVKVYSFSEWEISSYNEYEEEWNVCGNTYPFTDIELYDILEVNIVKQ